MGKILIAFYSRKGENFVDGGVEHLAVGNNEVLANKIKAMVGDADLFRIETVEEYPADYYKAMEQSKKELRANARPALSSHVENMEQYDLIILGYPNWWGKMPMPVYSFLEAYNLAGKTIVPFCTHEGSGLSVTVRGIEETCPESKVGSALVLEGSEVARADEDIKEWLQENNLL